MRRPTSSPPASATVWQAIEDYRSGGPGAVGFLWREHRDSQAKLTREVNRSMGRSWRWGLPPKDRFVEFVGLSADGMLLADRPPGPIGSRR